jgi:hypothetical protein
MNKIYLGDGVYACWLKDGTLVLTTEDGVSISNIIYLEPSVLQALDMLLTRRKAEVAESRSEGDSKPTAE